MIEFSADIPPAVQNFPPSKGGFKYTGDRKTNSRLKSANQSNEVNMNVCVV